MVLHRRETGGYRGRLASSFEVGVRCHFIGYSIIFMIVKVSHYGLVIHRPFSAISMFLGYSWSVISMRRRYNDSGLIRFMRRKKMEKLFSDLTGTKD